MHKKPLTIRLLHWLVAGLFLLSILSGYRQADTGWPGTGLVDRDMVHLIHETSGILIAFSFALWAFFRAYTLFYLQIKTTLWRRIIAFYHLGFGLFGATIAFLGWAGSSAGNYGQYLFAVIPVPNIIPVLSSKEAIFFYGLHMRLIPYLLTLIALHIAGVLLHTFILKDDTFNAMWFGRSKTPDQTSN